MTETELLGVKRWLLQWAIYWTRTGASPMQLRQRELAGRNWSWN